jgi:hypothetical protein
MQQEIAQPRPGYSGFSLLGGRWAALPRESVLGLVMIGLAWVVSWGQVHPLAQYYFFPIWLGYILLVDGLVLARRGTSLIGQGTRQFVALFVISAVFWWIFEAMNIPVQNWRYLGVTQYSTLEYTVFATLPFSTVLPAVLETATLIGSFLSPERYLPLAKVEPPSQRLWLLVALGVLAAVAPWIWPDQAYPLIWSSLVLVLEPINWMAGRPSTFRQLRAGNVTLLLTLFASGITCGFFWEMWNFYSYPKWMYVLPGITAPKLFEMPIPGYLGYLPFAMELYAMYNLVLLLTGRSSNFERVMQLPRHLNGRNGRSS